MAHVQKGLNHVWLLLQGKPIMALRSFPLAPLGHQIAEIMVKRGRIKPCRSGKLEMFFSLIPVISSKSYGPEFKLDLRVRGIASTEGPLCFF